MKLRRRLLLHDRNIVALRGRIWVWAEPQEQHAGDGQRNLVDNEDRPVGVEAVE